MQQATEQAIPLQQTGTADVYDVENSEQLQMRCEVPARHWLHSSLEDHLLKPKTRKGQVLCWSFWLIAVAVGCVLFWQVLPRFVDHAVLGFWWGFVVATIGTSIGMLLSFLVGKQIFRDRLHRWVEGNHKAEAMLLAISEAGSFKVIVLMRQVVPYTWLNYAASAPPEITLPWYMLASVIGQIPHNAVDVYLGGNVTGLGDLLAGKPANTATIVTYTLGFMAAALTAGLAYFYAKRALHKIEQRVQQHNSDDPQGVQNNMRNSRLKVRMDEREVTLDEAGQSMLLQQPRSDADAESPTVSDDTSHSQRQLLQSGCLLAADIESASV